MRTHLVITVAVVLGLAACGSSDGVKATATEGDAFCTLAQSAKDDNDALDNVDYTDAAKVKLSFTAAIDSLSGVAAKAPKDIADTVKALLAKEVELETLLKKYDYDVLKMSTSDEGKELIDDTSAKDLGDEFDKYLDDKCGIAPSDTTPSDSVAPDDTAGPSGTIDFGEGEEAINKFLDFYELGAGITLTDEQRSCFVDALSDKVQGTELNDAMNGTASPELEQAIGLALINCRVVGQS